MFDPSGFCHIASNARNRDKWSVFLYKSTDTVLAVQAPGYFDSKASELNLHDLILMISPKPNSGLFYTVKFLIVVGKTTDTIKVDSTIMSEWDYILERDKTDRSSDFMTPITNTNKGATATQINELIEQITGVQTDLTNLINTKTTKATDFVSPITSTNKGITQVQQSAIESQIDRAATSGKVIGAYWFGKTATGTAPNPTMPEQNYFDFTTNTPYKAKSNLSGWDAQPAIVPPADIDAQIIITSKFWNIPEQAGQQGGKAFWSHTNSDWAYFPTIVSFESPALSGVPTAPNISNGSPANQIANKEYVDSKITSGLFSALYPVGSLYITTNGSASCPIAYLIPDSQWQMVALDRALWGSSIGNLTLEAGLPNLQGWFAVPPNDQLSYPSADNSLFVRSDTNADPGTSYDVYGPLTNKRMVFDASKLNPIYGNSTTVQPPAYTVIVWRRTA